MKLLTTFAVALLSLPSASATGWGRPRGRNLSIPRGMTVKEGIAKKIVNKKIDEPNPLEITRGGAVKAKGEGNVGLLVKLGDIGNMAVIVLSVALLAKTLQVVKGTVACKLAEDSIHCIIPDDIGLSKSILDNCYICDGFCVSNPTNPTWNSHMLSLYADAIMTIPLLWLWFARRDDLEKLGLEDYFLGFKRLSTVIAHGLAHMGISILTTGGQEVNMPEGGIVNQAILFGTLYILMGAGLPPGVSHTKLIQIVSSAGILYFANAITAAFAGEDVGKLLGVSFVLVFTSTYLVSALAQVFFWSKEQKESRAKPYAVTALASTLVTTVVGWFLALRCTALKAYTGHMLYDLSIPVSYLLVYAICKLL